MSILRLSEVKTITGSRSHATIYNAVKAGLFPQAVPLGVRTVGWPRDEVETVLAARVAGAGISELRDLVQHLHTARHKKYETLLGRTLGATQ